MSATGRSDVRRTDDFYATPAWCVHRLLEADVLPAGGGKWFEPAVGDGAIVKAVHSFTGIEYVSGERWDCCDLRPNAFGDELDFLEVAPKLLKAGDHWPVAITNPPYSLALEFARAMLPLANYVAILTRLNFLAGGARRKFFANDMPDVYVLPNRPSFTEDGRTDATEYAWLVWTPERGRTEGKIRILEETPVKERRR